MQIFKYKDVRTDLSETLVGAEEATNSVAPLSESAMGPLDSVVSKNVTIEILDVPKLEYEDLLLSP